MHAHAIRFQSFVAQTARSISSYWILFRDTSFQWLCHGVRLFIAWFSDRLSGRVLTSAAENEQPNHRAMKINERQKK
jgi:hypothetical protein